MTWFFTIWTEMLIGNFSFAILVFAILQFITMVMNYQPKPKILNIDKTLIDPQKVIDIKLFIPEGDPFNNVAYTELTIQGEDKPILVCGEQSMRRAVFHYKRIYKKIYRRKLR